MASSRCCIASFRARLRVLPEGTSRRDFLKLMSASMALAGLSACVKQPLEPIVPYVRQPNEIVLGNPLFFASAMPFGAYGLPVLVESHEGRPTKIEGNPEHPAGLGGSDVFTQASILDMYDPDRAQIITYLGEIRNWSDYIRRAEGRVELAEGGEGRGPAHSQRAHQFADHGVADGPGADGVSGVEVDAVGAGESRQRACRIAYWPSGSTSRRATTWRRPTSFSRSTATSSPAASPDFCTTRGSLRRAQSRSQREDVALLLHSEHADQHQRQGRSSFAGAGVGSGDAGARHRRRTWARAADRHESEAGASEVRRRGGERSAGAQGRGGRHSRRQSAARRACLGACHESGAGRERQHRHLHRTGAGEAAGPDRRVERTGRRDERAARSTCCSSWAAIRCTTRPPISALPTRWTRFRCACSTVSTGRDLRSRALAHQRHALSGAVGRRSRLRRNGFADSAADRAAVQRQERVRVHLRAGRLAGDCRLRHRPQILAGPDQGRLRHRVAQGAERRLHRRTRRSRRRRLRPRAATFPPTNARQRGADGSDLPPRSDDLRRQPRQQRLAAGNAEADHAICAGTTPC